MILTPATANEAHKALHAWTLHLRQTGQPIPDGWPALVELAAAARRSTLPDPAPDWLTLDQAAERARVSPSTLYRWRADGLPSRQVRGRVLIARTDLDRWVRSPSGQSPVTTGQRVA